MDIAGLDHANLRTTRLDEMIVWYRDVLGFEIGWRPPFPFPGAWLYRHGNPLVHLVSVDGPIPDADNLTLEHVAFRARGRAAFHANLEALGVPFTEVFVPDTTLVQYNVHDPDGNHLHIDFDTSTEAA